jgi:hypothetical protein
MKVEATSPKTLEGVEREEMQRQIDMRLAAVSKSGRRLVLAYIGVWGCAYDQAAGVYRSGAKLWEGALQRGQKMEQTFQQRVPSNWSGVRQNNSTGCRIASATTSSRRRAPFQRPVRASRRSWRNKLSGCWSILASRRVNNWNGSIRRSTVSIAGWTKNSPARARCTPERDVKLLNEKVESSVALHLFCASSGNGMRSVFTPAQVVKSRLGPPPCATIPLLPDLYRKRTRPESR